MIVFFPLNLFLVLHGYQSEITSRLELHSGADQSRPCACCFSLCDFIWFLITWTWRALFNWESPSPLTLAPFPPPLPQGSLGPEGRDLMEIPYLVLSSVMFLFSGCESICVGSRLCWRKRLWWWLSKGTNLQVMQKAMIQLIAMLF